jgi:ABC-type oligopeptide transport system ATPase subunit
VQQVFTQPENAYTRRLLDAVPAAEPAARDARRLSSVHLAS